MVVGSCLTECLREETRWLLQAALLQLLKVLVVLLAQQAHGLDFASHLLDILIAALSQLSTQRRNRGLG
jgi:hypothetical protein